MQTNSINTIKYALKWGAILGLFRIILSILFTFVKELNLVLSLVIIPIMFVAVFVLIKKYKNSLPDGLISFNVAFLLCWQLFIYSGIIHYVYETIVACYFVPNINEKFLHLQEHNLASTSLDDEQIKMQMGVYKYATKANRVAFFSVVVGFIISLVVAAITKKEKQVVEVE